MTQDEYIDLLFDKGGFSEMSKRSLLRDKFGVTSIDDLPKHKKSELIDYLKEFTS